MSEENGIVKTAANVVRIETGIQPVTAEVIKKQVIEIHKVMTDLMKEGTHYGIIAGCGDKKVLLKPGAELIMTLFRIGGEPTIEEITDNFDVRYRVVLRGFDIRTGATVGYGIGEASTCEKKYKWRRAICHEEFDSTIESHRQIQYTKEGNGMEQVRQNPADITNTVLKMAKKRAMVDLCLTATACSDIFVQDIDDPDINEAVNPDEPPAARYKAPQKKPEAVQTPAGDVISEKQAKRLYAIGCERGLTKEEMSFLTFDIAHVNRSNEVKTADYEKLVNAFQTAVTGQIIPA